MGRGFVGSLRGGREAALFAVVPAGSWGLFLGQDKPFWSGDLAQQVL